MATGLSRRAARLTAALAAATALFGCPATGEEVRPPNDQFYYPTGMDISPDQGVLFVANANADLRYDSGTITVVSLSKVDEIVEGWLTTGRPPSDLGTDCDQDKSIPYTLQCNEKDVLRSASAVRIGNFATDLQVQALDDGTSLRLFAAVRGDPSVTWVDWDGEDLACGGTGEYPECDDDHRLAQLRNSSEFTRMPDEPFSVFVDAVNQYAVVTHLSSGAVSVADAPSSGADPILSDALGNLFAADPVTGVRGAVGVAGRQPGTENDRIYVTSRTEARVQTLVVVRTNGYPSVVPAEHFFLTSVIPSTNGRDIAFSTDGTRAYIVNRAPPMLHIVDTSLDEFGVPANDFLAGVELCPQASNVAVAEIDGREHVYVACFSDGQIWAIDPRGAVVDAIIDVGRGPHAVVVSETRRKLYVSNYLEDTVAVVDLVPESPTENRVVLRLGHPRQSGGE